MLHLHQSNRIENLFQALSDVLESAPGDVFAPEIIVVEEPGMARWLSQRIARSRGIAANIEFPLPAGFVWKILNAQLELDATLGSLGKSSLVWYAMQLLPQLRKQRGFETIDHYLSGPDEETRIYQLSREIADLFDQYLIYRPDMIMSWQGGSDSGWQAELWRAIMRISRQTHWAALVQDFMHNIEQQGFRAGRLPTRVSLFAINALSPGYIELLGQLARFIDIHLFIVNPSYHYWGDIVSERTLVRLRERWRSNGRIDVSGLYDVGNPLLASMAQPCRDFINQWHDLTPNEHEYFEPIRAQSLLASVQDDILNLQARGSAGLPAKTIEPDQSLQVHACHSPLREVQVLHDRLLGLFDKKNGQGLTDLDLRDVVVVMPDVNIYAAAIDAVFGAAPESQFIPYSIANYSPERDPIVETLLAWLLLPEDRFEAPVVMSWLELPAVRQKFRLSDEAIERIRVWVNTSGIRWGLDAKHKQQMGLPANEHNTWAFGFKRLYLGYAMPADAELFSTVAPMDAVEGGDAVWLGQLQAFVRQLAGFAREFRQSATPLQWQSRINRLIEQLLQPDEAELMVLDDLRQQLANLAQVTASTGFDEAISYRLLHQHLGRLLASGRAGYGLLGGRVTFCNMVAVRAIPFRVVCMLGMSDDSFPRTQQAAGFDLIAEQPRQGDRSLRDDDRNLFLQMLLSARDVVHISYVGRSQQDNAERQPSVVVTELLDYVEQGYTLPQGQLRDCIHIEQSLQAFSVRNFARGSFAGQWLQREETVKPFALEPLDQPRLIEPGLYRLESIVRFLVNPARHFLEQGLGVRAAEYAESLDDSEVFELDHIQAYAIKDQLLNERIQGADMQPCFERLYAQGGLPHGEAGHINFLKLLNQVDAIAPTVKDYLATGCAPRDIELILGENKLLGRLQRVTAQGLLHFRPARLAAKDKLRLWVEHLALCADGVAASSLHVAVDRCFTLKALQPVEAQRHLLRLIELYDEGLRRPIPLYPGASLEYVSKLKGDETDKALLAANKKWQSSEYARGDNDDPWIAMAFRDQDPFSTEFEVLAREVLLPLQACVKQGAKA
jgi:exodeoxyribonuclease V gamma subunit